MTTFLSGPVLLMALGTVFTGVFRYNSNAAPSATTVTTTPEILGRSHFLQHRHDTDNAHHHTTKMKSQKSTIDLRSYTKAARDDHIHDLPGLHYDPGFQQFAGYLTVDPDHGRNIFYWYVESQGNPAEDPVVLWTNGGPGCSGFVGLGTEHGPYYIRQNGTLSANPFSWNKLANVLYIEQPAGVGFSFSNTKHDYRTGDGQAARDNYRILREFIKRFPERQTNPLYISSESYGGHYMPQCKSLCCVVLYCVVLCCAVLCCTVLYCLR